MSQIKHSTHSPQKTRKPDKLMSGSQRVKTPIKSVYIYTIFFNFSAGNSLVNHPLLLAVAIA